MKNVLKIVTLSFLIGGMLSFSFVSKSSNVEVAQAGKWKKLGMRKVNMLADHDEIIVTAFEGFFTKLKFKVLDAPILVRSVKVVFGNGQSRIVKFGRKFVAGSESRVIDLPGNKRIIKKIVMHYTTVAKHKGKATVVVFGRR